MRPVFNDPSLEKTFQRQGYVVVPFLSPEQVNHLTKAFFDTQHMSRGMASPQDVRPESTYEMTYTFTFLDRNPDYKRKVLEIISESFQEPADKYLMDYVPIISNFIPKQPKSEETPIHQNWAFVDEDHCSSVSIWCPLVDCNKTNGTLEVVPGSHKRFGHHRGPMIPWELEDIEDIILEKYMMPIEVKAGEAVILDDSIIHYTGINNSTELRLATQHIMIPREFPSVNYRLNHEKPRKELEALEVDNDFYMTFHPWKQPQGIKRVLKTLAFNFERLSEKDFQAKLAGPRFDDHGAPKPAAGPDVGIPLQEIDLTSARNIFQNPDHYRQFEEQGYLVLSLFDPEELLVFDDIFSSNFPTTPSGFFSSSYLPDFDQKKIISSSIVNLIEPKLSRYFKDFRIQGAAFLSKASGAHSELPLHQDWTTVDETQYVTANIWTPITNINTENGALQVLPGSHKMFQELRAPTLPFSGMNISDELHKHLVTLYPKPGEVVLINHALVHYSAANFTNSKRLAFTAGIISKDAPVQYHFWDKETNELETYEMEDDFHLKWSDFQKNVQQRPSIGKLIDKRPYLPKMYTKEWFKASLLEKSQTSSKSSQRSLDVGQFYDAQTSNFLRIYGQVIQAFRTKNVTDLLDYQIESIGLEDGMKALDAGCGVCGPARYFAHKKNVEIDAVTISSKQVEYSKRYVIEEGLEQRITVHLGDFHDLSHQFEQQSYDVVYFLESFGHAIDHKQVIQESWNMLKPGGILYIKDLFIKEGIGAEHDSQIAQEIQKINKAYRYNIADLYKVLEYVRKRGFILSSLKTIDLPLEQFENLTISNDFQDLTGINKIDSLSDYVFPVDFYELKCLKPWNSLETGNNRYFLQNHYYMQVMGKNSAEL